MRNVSTRTIAVLFCLIALWTPASAQLHGAKYTYTSTFDGLTNDGWSFGTLGGHTIEPEGGNPGGYLRHRSLDTFAVEPQTLLGFLRTIYHGDYRARKVTSIGIDLAVFSADSTLQRPLTVILVDDGGTSQDPGDDCRVYRIGGHPTPRPNGVWHRYRFRIPSQSASLPPGWTVQDCAGLTDDEAWNRVITGVDQVRFFTGDPERFFIYQLWDVGIDNPSITYEPPTIVDP